MFPNEGIKENLKMLTDPSPFSNFFLALLVNEINGIRPKFEESKGEPPTLKKVSSKQNKQKKQRMPSKRYK
jgi:hypothetical protein